MKMKFVFQKSVLLFTIVILLITACSKDKVDLDADVSEIDSFIWSGLRQYYLWVEDVPNLVNPDFNEDAQLAQFLNAYNEEHENLFYDLLYSYGTIDKWSWIVDDYVALENYFQGVTTSMGMEYGLVKFSNSDNIFGFIQYVVPDSPAGLANLSRGELFTTIDGQTLNINNYQGLLFGREAFDISFTDDMFVLNGKTLSLTAAVVEEDPIHYSEIKDVNGTKVAYLVYNGFTSNYDHDLNDLFASYQAEGVQELILDLRYNGGGSVRTSIYLASMIYDTDTEQIFSKSQYNDVFQEYLLEEYGESFFEKNFRDEIEATNMNAATPINSLNLDRLYVLSTDGTASASELIINGLNPYLDVVIIGENTHGKYVGSITLKDYDSNGVVNRNHTWAMQPIVFKTTNSVGFSDYVDGFSPDVFLVENFTDLLPFGDEDDPLLKTALNLIEGISPPAYHKNIYTNTIMNSKDLRPFSRDMYIDLDLK